MKGLLFDFDGVIVDSFEILYQSVLEAFNKDISRDEYRKFYEGDVLASAKKLHNGTKMVGKGTPVFSRYIPRLYELHPVDGIADTLSNLSESYQITIVTSCLGDVVETFLKMHNLERTIHSIYGSDFHPDKHEKMHIVFEKYGLDPQKTLYVTDTLGDLRVAERVGIRGIGVTWGFHDRETLEKGKYLKIVDTPDQLKNEIDSILI